MRPSASSSGRRRTAREEEDAHLWASDATLFARTIEAGPDLYASDAALFSGDARDHGADLWASDAALFATSEDHARRELAALRQWLVARACSADQSESALEPERACAVCLGEMGNAQRGERGAEENERDPRSVALPCGHAYHLRCALAALDASSSPFLCPTCRSPVRRDSDDETRRRRGRDGVF